MRIAKGVGGKQRYVVKVRVELGYSEVKDEGCIYARPVGGGGGW